jgi:sodium transport system ATP-binding protein
MEGEARVEAHEVCKYFTVARPRGRWFGTPRELVRAVDGVSFVAEPGKIFGLLGPNGAGKTTTMRLLATTVTPTSGTARVAGHDVRRDPVGARRSLGMLTTSIGLYARLTARENVAYFANLYAMDPAHAARRIEGLFRLLEMDEFADRRTDNFSTGMKQKVAIARSVVHDPPVMIFDEPTSGLDVMSSRTVVAFIRSMRDSGKCVILSTHLMHEVARLCDTVCIIYQGRVVAGGTPGGLVEQTGQRDLEDAFLHLVGADTNRAREVAGA